MSTVRDRDPQVEAGAVSPTRRRLGYSIAAFAALAVIYAIYTVLVVKRSDVGLFDRYVYTIHFRRDILPYSVYEFLLKYVLIGQRGIATFVFLPYFIWTAWRLRSARPIVTLIVALFLLNLSVGAVKLSVGRLGPRVTTHYFDVMMGGDIYPSGHVANTVVLYGAMAMISLRHRRLFTWITIWLAVSVAAGSVMVNTHWFSDIVGGWMAGGLVLLATPWFTPAATRAVERFYARRVKAHTDPLVTKLVRRWPVLGRAGTWRPDGSRVAVSANRVDAGQLDRPAP